jgi:hypothetical protein
VRGSDQGSNGGEMATSTEPGVRGRCLPLTADDGIAIERAESWGAPHYHVIISGEIPNDEVVERWYRIIGSGDERHLKAGTRVEGIRSKGHLFGYLYNYIKKLDQKKRPEEFENVGRFWGSSRNLLAWEGFERIGYFYKLVWSIKLIRNWYKAHLRTFGIKWRWKGKGFTALDGVRLVNQIMSLRL